MLTHAHEKHEEMRRGIGHVPAIEIKTKAQAAKTHAGHRWSPYEDNGGTVMAICGKGFAIVGADTRLNGDFCFHTRNDSSKICQLTPSTVLVSGGMQADRLQLQQILKFKLQWYQYNNAMQTPSTRALGQLLSTELYHRRFFPIYTFNLLAGLDEDGDGVVFGYDAVGCVEALKYGSAGSGNAFVEPLMDCVMLQQNRMGGAPPNMTQAEALDMMKAAFTTASERDIYTGDSVNFVIVTAAGTTYDSIPLRRD